MDKAKLTKLLEKTSTFEKGLPAALSKEFISIEDNLLNVNDTLTTLTNKINEDIVVELEII